MTSVTSTVGIDAHKDTFTYVMLDPNHKTQSRGTLPNTTTGHEQLLERIPGASVFAIENPHAYALALTRHLLDAKRVVFSISPNEVASLRRRRSRAKNDMLDAEQAARVLLGDPQRRPVGFMEERYQLRIMHRTRERLVRQRVAVEANLKALPGFAPDSVREALTAVMSTLKEQIRELESALRESLKPYELLLAEVGVGIVTGAALIGEAQSMRRFGSEAAFASYCGVAPRESSSGLRVRVRVNPGGNRVLNRALEVITWTRIRCCEKTAAYYRKKRAQGMPARMALRATKRVVCRDVYGVLLEVLT